MKQLNYLLMLIVSFGILAPSIHAQSNKKAKKRVAVFLFEDKSGGRGYWYGGQGVGEGVTDMLTTELVKSGQYQVIERNQLDQLLQEQDLGRSGLVTPQSAAAVGKLLGVELAVMGAVTEFGNKKGDSNMRIGGTRLGVGRNAAVVAIDLRLVNTSTGEIVLAENVRKTKNGLSGSIGHKNMNFNSRQQFNNSLVGKATRAAVENVIELIGTNSSELPWEAKVIVAKNGDVFINSGKTGGVEVGETFTVMRPGEALIDPDTGLNLGSVDTEVGTIKVVDNSIGEGKASKCRIVSGNDFSKGDLVKMNSSSANPVDKHKMR